MGLKNPVMIRGVLYESQAAAGRSLGVSKSTIFRGLDEGNIDIVGLGRNCYPPLPVTVNGVTHRSINVAARSMGISNGALSGLIFRRRKAGIRRVTYKGFEIEW